MLVHSPLSPQKIDQILNKSMNPPVGSAELYSFYDMLSIVEQKTYTPEYVYMIFVCTTYCMSAVLCFVFAVNSENPPKKWDIPWGNHEEGAQPETLTRTLETLPGAQPGVESDRFTVMR